MAEEQAVVDHTDTESTTSAEEGSAQDDLDSLLSQWESASDNESDQGGQSETDSDPKKKLEYIEQYLQRQEEERAQERVQKDLDSTAKSMRESIKDQMDVPEELLKQFLHGRAAMDSRVLNAWNNRHKDDTQWQKTASAIAKDFVKQLQNNVDPNATSDRDAVQSAVRSASKSPSADEGPREKDLEKMSDREFQKKMREMM